MQQQPLQGAQVESDSTETFGVFQAGGLFVAARVVGDPLQPHFPVRCHLAGVGPQGVDFDIQVVPNIDKHVRVFSAPE